MHCRNGVRIERPVELFENISVGIKNIWQFEFQRRNNSNVECIRMKPFWILYAKLYMNWPNPFLRITISWQFVSMVKIIVLIICKKPSPNYLIYVSAFYYINRAYQFHKITVTKFSIKNIAFLHTFIKYSIRNKKHTFNYIVIETRQMTTWIAHDMG